jgi:ATP-dependent protease Clp ATPase subunit
VPEEPFCSFCGKRRSEVRKLIQGGGPDQPGGRRDGRDLPLVQICNECISLCNEIIVSQMSKQGGP